MANSSETISSTGIRLALAPVLRRSFGGPSLSGGSSCRDFYRKIRCFCRAGLSGRVATWIRELGYRSRWRLQVHYTLLSVIMISNFMAILLQSLSLKLGLRPDAISPKPARSLHQARSFCLWVICELAIAACDLAEVIGSAIALNLLFGIPSSGSLYHRARCARDPVASK